MNRRMKTDIWVTVGPSLEKSSVIRKILDAGVCVFRCNLSHGDEAWHRKMVERIRRCARGRPVRLVFDLEGWRIRLGWFRNAIPLREGERIVLTEGEVRRKRGGKAVPIDADIGLNGLRAGMDVYIDDGKIWLRVVCKKAIGVETVVIRGGTVTARKGVNIPAWIPRKSKFLSEQDERHIRLGLELRVDAFALSFVTRGADVREVLRFIRTACSGGSHHPSLIAKIENRHAVSHLSGIIKVADAVMVARGDLGVSLPIERLPVLQKEIVWAALQQHKPVIVATQMLESMIHSPRPTRAEVSDVGNAVFDGADGLLLSGETAVGRYPVEAVVMMRAVVNECHHAMRRWRKSGGRHERTVA